MSNLRKIIEEAEEGTGGKGYKRVMSNGRFDGEEHQKIKSKVTEMQVAADDTRLRLSHAVHNHRPSYMKRGANSFLMDAVQVEGNLDKALDSHSQQRDKSGAFKEYAAAMGPEFLNEQNAAEALRVVNDLEPRLKQARRFREIVESSKADIQSLMSGGVDFENVSDTSPYGVSPGNDQY